MNNYYSPCPQHPTCYIPSSNLFCGYYLSDYDVIYDEIYETYSVIYEVITRKFRVSMDPLKISKYVE